MGLCKALDFIANSASKFDILHTLQQVSVSCYDDIRALLLHKTEMSELLYHIEHFHVMSLLPCWRAKTIHFLSPGK